MFDNFPYTNFHEMNLDWMIKIAKDFLDQYTSIQETITQGLEDLDTKAQQLEALLQAWYDQHSQDIADQLADALADLNEWYTQHQDYLDQTLQDNIAAFNQAADQKTEQSIASIPDDYTEVSNDVKTINNKTFAEDSIYLYVNMIQGEKVTGATGVIETDPNYCRSDYIDTMDASRIYFDNPLPFNLCCYDADKNFVYGYSNSYTSYGIDYENIKYVIFTMTGGTITGLCYLTSGDSIKNKINNLETDTHSLLYQSGEIDVDLKMIYHEKVTGDSGVISSDTTRDRSDYILTRSASRIYFEGNLPNNLCAYDENKNFLYGYSGSYSSYGLTNNVCYVIFTIATSTRPSRVYLNNAMGIYGNKFPWCYKNKINWIGDSIVADQDFDNEVCDAMGLIENADYGINGSTIALKADGTDGRDAMCVRYSSMSDDVDIIAVSGGTNDFQYAWCPIGTINDPDDGTSNTTFYGALKTLCKGLITKYPQKLIFFTTPIKRGQAFEDGNGGSYTPDGIPTNPFSKNKYGKTLMDYADIIKEVCGYYSIPVLDLYRESLLNPNIPAQAGLFDNVLTHPNATGQKIMARRVSGWLAQLGYKILNLNM